MGIPVTQIFSSFNGGVISPKMAARVDFGRYFNSLKTLSNMTIMPQGGATRRTGSRYIADAAVSSRKSKLVPFEFSDEVAYMLEFGHNVIHFFKDGAQIQAGDLAATTKLQLSMDGSQGSTSFPDDSTSDHTVTAQGGAFVDQVQTKFENGSLKLNGSTDYLTVPDSADFFFDTGDMTIDFWIRPNVIATSTDYGLFTQYTDSNNYVSCWLNADSDDSFSIKLKLVDGGTNQISIGTAFIFNPVGLSANTWSHVVITREDSFIAVGVNGISSTWALADNEKWEDFTGTFQIGRESRDGGSSFTYLDGRIDEFRVTKGLVQWSGALTPGSPGPATQNNGTYPVPTSPYSGAGGTLEVETTYTEGELDDLSVAQSADVLYIDHPAHPPAKLSRTSDIDWELIDVDFLPEPTSEAIIKLADTLTYGSTTGSGVTMTVGSALVLEADDERLVRSGTGRAIITSITSTTEFVVDIINEMPSSPVASGSWQLEGSPFTKIKPSGKNKNSIITITSDDTCWRASNVGQYVRVHGGICKIQSITSTTIVVAEVLSQLSVTTKTENWTLEAADWSSGDGYPGVVSFHEERLFHAGSDTFPDTIWGSMVGDYENHSPGALDADAVKFTLASREVNRIISLVSHQSLFVGTIAGEWIVNSSSEVFPITPTSIMALEQTSIGSKKIAPLTLGHANLFVQRRGHRLFEQTFSNESDRFIPLDLSILAEHLTRTTSITDMAWAKDTEVAWVIVDDGTLLGLTFSKAHEIAAWHSHSTGASGSFESVAVIPTDANEQVWLVVKRTIDGSVVRYIEVFEPDFNGTITDSFFVDAGKEYDSAATDTFTGLSHLEDQALSVLADGEEVTGKTVSSGSITLDAAASHVIVGIPFTSTMELLDVELVTQGAATSQGQRKKLTRTALRLFETAAASLGPSLSNLTAIPFTSAELFTGDKQLTYLGGWINNMNPVITTSSVLPMTVLGIIGNFELGTD